MHNAVLTDWIRQASTKAELVLSVCTGALLLADLPQMAALSSLSSDFRS